MSSKKVEENYYFFPTEEQKKLAGEQLVALLKDISKESKLNFYNFFSSKNFDASENYYPYYVNLWCKAFFGPQIFRDKAKKELMKKIKAQFNSEEFREWYPISLNKTKK